MPIFRVAALVLLIFALIVAAGNAFITGWNVWLCAGLLSWVLDSLVGSRFTVKT